MCVSSPGGVSFFELARVNVPRGDLAAVCAMTNEGVHEPFAAGRYFNLHGATIACSGRCTVLLTVRAF